jgi:hypothetical protein
MAAVGINPSINYQGKLTTTAGAAIANGKYNMRFKIFNAATGGVAAWTETWSNATQRVTATGGLFTVGLGSVTTMTGSVNFNSDSLYLQIEFDPGNDGTYEEVFAPRRRFSAVPYAHNARLLEGLTASQFLRSDTTNASITGDIIEGNQVIANTSFSGSQITIMRGAASYFLGNVGIGSGTGLEARTTIYTEDSLNKEALRINSNETGTGQDLFKILSDVGTINNTVFRIRADGSTFSDNAYSSSGADYAEWFKSDDILVPGEVVCIDILQNNAVRRCTRSGDTNIMGIVSTNPAFIGNTMTGAEGLPIPGYYLIGLIGQVPTRVSLENAAVLPGDSLTASSTPGIARKASAGESTVGVALEAYDGTQASNLINVLISRRNQSMTMEGVEQHVLESIASMNISDEVQQMVQKNIVDAKLETRMTALLSTQMEDLHLAATVEKNIASYMQGSGRTLIRANLEPLDNRLTALLGTSALISARITSIEDSLNALQSSAHILSAFSGSYLRINTLTAHDASMTSLMVRGLLRVAGRAEIGAFSASGSVVQIGSLNATGSLKIIGDMTITGFATIEKDLRIKGQLILSNKQAGYAVIPLTGTSVTVRFLEPMVSAPIVTATPESPVLYAVSKVTATGFTIRIAPAATEDIRFSYIALSADAPKTVRGTGSSAIHQFPVNELGQPISSNPVWNSCIRGQVMMLGGEPVNCSRYHNDSVWEHPDFNISFIYNANHEPPILTLPTGYIKSITSEPNAIPEAPVLSNEPVPSAPVEDTHTAAPEEVIVPTSPSEEAPSSGDQAEEPAAPVESAPEPILSPEPTSIDQLLPSDTVETLTPSEVPAEAISNE